MKKFIVILSVMMSFSAIAQESAMMIMIKENIKENISDNYEHETAQIQKSQTAHEDYFALCDCSCSGNGSGNGSGSGNGKGGK